MRAPVDVFFPPRETGRLPYWRLVLRGCSQLCFQGNELTGVLFLAAVLVASPIAAAYMLVAATIAPGGRMLLGDRGAVLETGLPGLNPCLIALALPAFFHTGWSDAGMWVVLVLSVASTILLTRLSLALLPFPTLVVPFLITFWVLSAAAPATGVLQPIAFPRTTATAIHPLEAMLLGLGQTMFLPNVLSGLLFLTGVLLSNWRHASLAVLGTAIGTTVSIYNRDVVDLAGIDLGLYGFNGVLAAVSVFVFCGGKLRLAILGALVATILVPIIPAFGVKALAAPFVLTTWAMLALGWLEDHWFGLPLEASPIGDPAAGAGSSRV